jgi:hypothetical protein
LSLFPSGRRAREEPQSPWGGTVGKAEAVTISKRFFFHENNEVTKRPSAWILRAEKT